MALRLNPKKIKDRTFLKALQAVQEAPRNSEEAPAVSQAGQKRKSSPVRSSPRPGTLAWATERGWQLGTHNDGGALLVYAWKPSGKRTLYYPAGPDTTEATHYRLALDAAVALDAAAAMEAGS